MLTGGPVVDRVWRQLLERGGIRPVVPLTHDPDLHLEVDGQRVDAVSSHGDAVVFALTGVAARGACRLARRVAGRAGGCA